MTQKIKLVVLGSTGSIGRQTVAIAEHYADRIEVVALAAHSNAQLLQEQAVRLNVPTTALAATHGSAAVVELAGCTDADIVLNAMVGAAGLEASYAALKAGKRLALANKESLVVGGELLMPLATPQTLLPVDSEHSAIYQCLLGESQQEVEKLWITASGGPFRGYSREQLATVTVEQALAHPTWQMGPKITIDSATLMNKGLEVIEAYHLFAINYSNIKVVVHPQSCIHSLVAYNDGSIKAHLGVTNMSIPIQFALSYPQRWDASIPAQLDLTQLQDLTFQSPDMQNFGCLSLARIAGAIGGTLPAVLNAANEVAVAAFLDHRCGFLDIEATVERTLEKHEHQPVESIEQLIEVDSWARQQAAYFLR
jgi:1-deoxy-D-xylulose-5-phosphate reductoisomerase